MVSAPFPAALPAPTTSLPGRLNQAGDSTKRKAEDDAVARSSKVRSSDDDDEDDDDAPEPASPPKRHKQSNAAAKLRDTALAASKSKTSVNNNNNNNNAAPQQRSVGLGDKVVLVIDHRELKKKRGQALRQLLQELGIPMLERALNLTDMIWIVQCGNRELVLKHG